MAFAQRIVLGAALQLVRREAPHALEEAVARGSARRSIDDHQQSLGQTREQVQHLELVAGIWSTPGPRASSVQPPVKTASRRIRSLLGREQMIEAPLDGREHGLLARGAPAPAPAA